MRMRIFLLIAAVGLSCSPAISAPSKPNFLVILADDMGFSDIGCYGGEIKTPNVDRLADGGLRYTQFYNTARCWPTRSALLTGYYPQQVRMDPPKGRLPQWARMLPHHLKPLGYRSYHVGKWHVSGAPQPVADGGFDRSYHFEDWDRHFSPDKHFENGVKLPSAVKNSGYYSSTAFADHTIRFLKDHAKDHSQQPFFAYLAFVAPHFPLHALPEDIAGYRDRYLAGWDEVRRERRERLKKLGIVECDSQAQETTLPLRVFHRNALEKLGPGEMDHALPWNELTDEQKKFQATKMAIHAAMVDRLDRELGRVIDQLRDMNALDNTVIFFLSDNGADASILIRGDGHDPAASPGSAETFLCLGPGWATASNAPFRRHKIWTHEGGISTPLVVHWPKGVKARGELRRDMGHVIDLAPTMLDLAGAPAAGSGERPAAPAMPGKSLAPSFGRDGTVTRDFLYFHHQDNRALRMGNWKIVSSREDGKIWELFNLKQDRGELTNLAEQQPDRVRAMAARWQELDDTYRKQAGTAKKK